MKILVILLLAGAFLGCSQNPLDGLPDSVQNPVDPGKKPGQDREPIREDLLYLDLKESSSLKFTEGFKGVIQFDGRVLTEEPTPFAIEIENMPEGASYDETTMEMTWEVPTGFIAGNRPILDYPLQVVLYTTQGPVQVKKKEFFLRVSKNFGRPEITSLSRSNDKLLEGEQGKIIVEVRDGSSSIATPPELIIVKPKNYASGAPLAEFSDPVLVNPTDGKWKFEVKVDTEALTHHEDVEYEFNFIAVSSVGVKSKEERTNIVVLNKVAEPELLSEDFVTVYRGQRSVVQFTVAIPDNNGRLSLNWSQCLGQVGVVDCSCSVSNRLGTCSVIVEPTSQVDEYLLEIESANKNKSRSADVESNKFVVVLEVEDIPTNISGGDGHDL